MAALSGKLTKKLVENLGAGRHGDGAGLYLVVDPSGARRWIVRVTVKGQKNRKGAPLRTDFGLGGADIVTLNQARERALEYRRMAKTGLNPRFNAQRDIPTFEEISRQVHIDRMPTWKNAKHGQQWMNTLRDYAFPKIGRMPIDSIGQPEVLMCLSPIWTDKHETAKRLAQRIKTVLDVAKSKGFRSGENPVTAVRDARVFLDNIFVERLWRSLKYECVYLHAWETGSEAKAGVGKWIKFYNHKRPHSALGGKPPAVIYWRRNETTNPDQQVQRVA